MPDIEQLRREFVAAENFHRTKQREEAAALKVLTDARVAYFAALQRERAIQIH